MSRTMYDSIDATAIPADAEMVAGYVDGKFVWPQSSWDRFPSAMKVRIAVFASTNDGTVLDVENGDATPAQAPGWLKNRLAAGERRPTIYCNRDTRAAVETACQGIQHDLWIATLDGTENIPGTVAVQYAGSAITHSNYDLSIVTDDSWPGGDMAQLDDIQAGIGALEYMLVPTGGGTTLGEIALRIRTIDDHLNQLTQTVSTLKESPVDIPALVAALVPALLKEQGKDLENG